MTRRVLHASAVLIGCGAVLLAVAGREGLSPAVGFVGKLMLVIGGGGILIGLGAGRCLGETRADRLLFPLFTLVISSGLVLVLAELAVRGMFSDVTTTADNNSYFARRWQRAVRVNRWNFRDREVEAAKPAGVYRIVVVGDSITYGQGIPEEARFTNLLEDRLNRKKAGFEVLNLGRPGAETEHELRILKDVALSLGPDFILLQWFTNDVEGHDKSERPRPYRLIPSDFLSARLQANSVLFYLANQQWLRMQMKLGWMQTYDDFIVERFRDPGGRPWIVAASTLREFIQVCRGNGVPMGIVLFSGLGTRASALEFLTERVLTLCGEERVPCVDLRRTVERYRGQPQAWSSRLDPHPGTLIHRLVAEHLMETFGELWLAERREHRPQTGRRAHKT